MSFDTLSGNFAGRFSRKLITPSFTSAERPRSKMPRESILCASMGSSAPSMRQTIWRISATETGDVLSTISLASFRASGNSWSGGSTLRTRPPRKASSALKTRPE